MRGINIFKIIVGDGEQLLNQAIVAMLTCGGGACQKYQCANGGELEMAVLSKYRAAVLINNY